MADMILPKGIVFNRNSIYEEIAKYDIVPIEQILEACHVFTTTSRELVDPTARRLENFWTRVLGGNRRYLPGTVIARLFRSISEEESFVKLRGPPNRYEPPSPDSKSESPPKTQAKQEKSGEVPSESKSKGKAKATKAGPSSTKQPHPILKKPRGPSSSGPRPTARFVSPPGSDRKRDDGKDGDLASSGSTAVNHGGDSRVSSSTVKEEKRKATNTTPKKKTTAFVASTASRRRPAMPRRISSQSSSVISGADSASREGGSSVGSKHSGSQSSTSTVLEKSGKAASSITEEGSERLSAKAAGKRPTTRPPPDESSPTKPSDAPTAPILNQLPVQDEPSNMKQPDSTGDDTNKATVDDVSPTKKAGQSGTIHRRSDAQERPRAEVSPIMTRSRSDMGSSRRSSQDGFPPSQSLTSSSTTTISNTIAQGTIIEFDENPVASEAEMNAARGYEDDFETGSRRSGSSVLDTRFTPTQPSTTPNVPLGRSKSQLTLLLERQGEKKPRR
ncbi:uncharacterized protein F4822DRAFT_111813 [Hypoxylon trugodes]|uniref:uncharacterized protein n=1 Tax=Hypoxylon trugodes TaxID=326681 RepID=UPI0021922346|nr:uncharacterized protein F4822DRAFT_111813 [Hypoxylon trugodes]KAI1391998.1 hypothetical protein F4822DRAFT_111813 [Hypoxylon trugodes]